MPVGFAAHAARLVIGASLLVATFALPALAAPANVTGMAFESKQQVIAIGVAGTVSVRTQRVKNPDRLVIDLTEARLPVGQPLPIVQPKTSRIRSIRMGQNSYVPAVVRVVVDLMPGFEPMVKITQSNGKLMITLANPAPPQGERDLESLPGFPSPEDAAIRPSPILAPPDAPLPEIVTRVPSTPPVPPVPPAPPAPKPVATPRPLWTPPPVPGWVSKPMPVPAEPASGLPASGPLVSGPPTSGSPVSGLPGSAPPARPLPRPSEAPTPGGASVVLIPDDVRPPAPKPTPVAPVDPFSPWSPQPMPSPSSPPSGTTTGSGTPTGEAPESEGSDSVLPPERQPSAGLGSTFQLRWQQVETLEEYGGPDASFAYPAGINGFDLEHWFMPYVGAGLDARVLFYDLTVESVRQHRSDVMLGSFVALRYPFGILEPSLRAGYMGRSVTVESESTGTTFPFSPMQTYYGPALTGRLKVTLLPGLGLDLHGKLLPGTQGSLYPGFPSIFPLSGRGWGASLVTDVMNGYVSLGYTTEQQGSSDATFRQTFSGITLGAGMRY
ncbi:hypothetical protein D3C72_196910 [compost metagenome]